MRALFTTPLGWVFVLGVLALARAALSRRARGRGGRRATGFGTLAAAWLVLMAASSPFVASALAARLAALGERWPQPPAWAAEEPPDVLLVFSGDLLGDERRRDVTLGPASLQRLHAALAAARRWPAARVVFSGGSRTKDPVTAGMAMAEEAVRAGLDPARVIVEARSPDTRGNAVRCARIVAELGARRAALVTSPDHMARARAALAREGVASLALPSAPPPRAAPTAGNLLPDATALQQTTSAVHELIGLFVYRLRGWL